MILLFGVYGSLCLLSTMYDLGEKYKRDFKKVKMSKIQNQMRYEEQQRKLMKNLKREDIFAYEIMLQNTTENNDGFSEDRSEEENLERVEFSA